MGSFPVDYFNIESLANSIVSEIKNRAKIISHVYGYSCSVVTSQ